MVKDGDPLGPGKSPTGDAAEPSHLHLSHMAIRDKFTILDHYFI